MSRAIQSTGQKNSMRVTLIGSGNVATHFGAALKNAGHHIVQVYSPTYPNAALLAYHIGAEAIGRLEDIDAETDMFIISVKDDAIEGLAQQLSVYQKLTVHTSGATDLKGISQYNKAAGVIYPLQTSVKHVKLISEKCRYVLRAATSTCIPGLTCWRTRSV